MKEFFREGACRPNDIRQTPEQKAALREIVRSDNTSWVPKDGELGWVVYFSDDLLSHRIAPCLVLEFKAEYGYWVCLSSKENDPEQTVQIVTQQIWATREAAETRIDQMYGL